MEFFINGSYKPKNELKTLNIQKEYEQKLNTLININSERPAQIDIFGNQIFGLDSNMYAGYRGNNLFELYWLWVLSDVTTTISNVLKRKVFRGGLKIEPIINEPNEDEETKIKEFIKCCNSDNQSYREVLKEIYDDLNWADTGVQLNLRDYYINSNNKLIGGKLREVIRVNPLNVVEIKDPESFILGILGNKQVYTELDNRGVKTFEPINKVTGHPNIPVHYYIRTQTGEKYYNKNELIIKHKFKERTGFSPIHSVKNKLLTLMEMDYYVKKEYGEGKPSKKMMAFKTQNREAMKTAVDDYQEKVKNNPNGLYPLIVQSSPDNRQPIAEVIDFMRPLDEMQYNQMRERYITDIGAVWGTSPMFHNDMSTGGGLNNEGLQMTVTNEVVEDDKARMEEDFITPTFEQLGTDISYRVCLYPNREEDLVAKEELFKIQLENTKAFIELGGNVDYNEGKFIFKENSFNQESMQPEQEDNFNFDNDFEDDDFSKSDNDPCWEGYEMIGYKMKNGKKVPNCVPKKKSVKKEERTNLKDLTSVQDMIEALENEM